MPDPIQLVLTKRERDAIASDLHHYGVVHAAVPDNQYGPASPRGGSLTLGDDMETVIGSHATMSHQCEALAVAFENEASVPMTLEAIILIRTALAYAHPVEMPPELARMSAFAWLANRQAATSEFVAVAAEMQPPATPGVAPTPPRNVAEVEHGIDWLGDRLGMAWAHAHALALDPREANNDVAILVEAWRERHGQEVPEQTRLQVMTLAGEREARLGAAKSWHRQHEPRYLAMWEVRQRAANTVADEWRDERELIVRHKVEVHARELPPRPSVLGTLRAVHADPTKPSPRAEPRKFGWHPWAGRHDRNEPPRGRSL
ncbi:MAG: hypothetical protein BGN97_09965 [Microbacterium sp. 69-10]|uniref:hypothetical protein n=1 Tax=Microbacterium sp. 69-10 TaxID=1895783 RepID=UPI00095E89F9|nr:hypothetical protein [Microbacterium sp. 69-10]OJU41490.1 MAG: hypothetical protein BGN97_09965 [Microbacterium sp. 69-10]